MEDCMIEEPREACEICGRYSCDCAEQEAHEAAIMRAEYERFRNQAVVDDPHTTKCGIWFDGPCDCIMDRF